MKVIVAVDDSPMSTTLVENIVKRHWPEDAQFKVLTVLEPVCCASYMDEFSEGLVKIVDHRLAAAGAHCEKIRQKLETKIPSAKVHFDIRQGSVASQIIDAAVEWSADKILLGAHSKSVCPHNLLGSVSRLVASHSPCSVEIVRAKERAKNPGKSLAPTARADR